jgi:toxin ParE1/3/4
MSRASQRAGARRDLVDHFVYLAETAGLDTAERFLPNAETSFNLLATQPNMGTPLALKRPELEGLRKWRVDSFDSILIFYLPQQDGISVVRVLHGSSDWWRLLGVAS